MKDKHIAIVGGGFTGLSAALELVERGYRVTVLEADDTLGGLGGGFPVAGGTLEKFYHHWFVSDHHIMGLIDRLGAHDRIVKRPTRTGMYFANHFFRLSSPLDVLRFTPLRFVDRIRLGLTVFRARMVRDWRKLEGLTAKQWLISICGVNVYRVVWEPLIVGKFGPYADDVSAVWFWKKIVLRGSSRGEAGKEVLAYFRGGFAELATLIGARIRALGGEIRLGERAQSLVIHDGAARAVNTNRGTIDCDAILLTTPLPLAARLLEGSVPAEYLATLDRIRYLANVCLVLLLDRSLSDTYWLNVNDPGFPFVGVIEHTNFEPPESYGGRHVVYLSKYLPASHPMYAMDAKELLEFSIPHIERMFPEFDRSWVVSAYAWKADYAQPIAERHYSALVPGRRTPIANVRISTMAQIYPEDRGTNYAVREGLEVAGEIDALLST